MKVRQVNWYFVTRLLASGLLFTGCKSATTKPSFTAGSFVGHQVYLTAPDKYLMEVTTKTVDFKGEPYHALLLVGPEDSFEDIGIYDYVIRGSSDSLGKAREGVNRWRDERFGKWKNVGPLVEKRINGSTLVGFWHDGTAANKQPTNDLMGLLVLGNGKLVEIYGRQYKSKSLISSDWDYILGSIGTTHG